MAHSQSPPPLTSALLNYEDVEGIINAIYHDELDYLIHAEKIKRAFILSRDNNWTELYHEAIPLVAELLFRQERYDEQIEHIDKHLPLLDPIADRPLYLLMLESKIRYLSRIKEQQTAHDIISEMESLIETLSEEEKIIIYRCFAYYYTAFDSMEETLEHAINGLTISETLNNNGASGFFLQKISDAYSILGNIDSAITFAHRAVGEYEKTNDAHLTSKAYWSAGNVNLKAKNIDKSLLYFNKALKYFKQVGMQKGIVFAQYSIANVQFSQARYEDSMALVNDNIQRAENAGIYDMQIASMILKGEIYAKQDKWLKTEEMNDAILDIVDNYSRTHYKSDYFHLRYELKKRLGKHEDAYAAIEQHIVHLKEHLSKTRKESIKTLQGKLELREKEAEIDRLAQEKSISELRIKDEHQGKIIWRLSASIAILTGISALFLFYWQLLRFRKYHNISRKDELTKAFNRRGVLAIAEEMMKHNDVTVAMVDLDHFKTINDNFGHAAGDAVLVAFAKAAKASLRENDKFGRYGGEEWLFIINTIEEDGIESAFQRLRNNYQHILTHKYTNILPNDWPLTFSMGARRCRIGETNLKSAIDQADKLLYQAKENGRNQIIIR